MRNGTRRARVARFLLRLFIVLAALGVGLLLWTYGEATSTPLVRRATVVLPGLARPMTVLLVSDIHVAGPDMPPERLRKIVQQMNALAPDVVLIAGDLVSDKRTATRYYSMAEAIAPLAGLKPRMGTIAVLGNHDHWRDAEAARIALKKAGVKLLSNDAAVVGPLLIGGLDDDFTSRDDLPTTLASMERLKGARLILSHSPDPFPEVPADVGLMLAGHTHCGQIAPPLIGPMATMSRHGERYACGLVREGRKTLIVSAGLGTSVLPLRLGARPDMWLLTLSGRR